MKKLKQKGFSAPEVLLILVVIILVALAGFYIWRGHRQATPTVAKPKQNDIAIQTCATEPELTAECAKLDNPPAGWTTYKSKQSTIRFLYPTSWRLEHPIDHTACCGSKENYYLEEVELIGPNGFQINFTVKIAHKLPLQTWACQVPLKQTNIALNDQYNLVVNGTANIELLSSNPNYLKGDDPACGSQINILPNNKLFKLTGAYAINPSGVQSVDGFLGQPEVQTARTIFGSLHQ